MIGSDLPTLPIEQIRQAINIVDPQTVVLGPAEDGGYYLIALAIATGANDATIPDLFSDIRWSTKKTLDDTRAAAIRAGLKIELLPSWYDVDDAEGLKRLRSDLRKDNGRTHAQETKKVLAGIFKKKQ